MIEANVGCCAPRCSRLVSRVIRPHVSWFGRRTTAFGSYRRAYGVVEAAVGLMSTTGCWAVGAVMGGRMAAGGRRGRG